MLQHLYKNLPLLVLPSFHLVFTQSSMFKILTLCVFVSAGHHREASV